MTQHTEPADKGTGELDLYANDPFFKRIFDGQWNACIGRQGHEENYIDGYIEAAIELADAIFEKQLIGKRDTLVLPILYNARHALELALKFATEHLIEARLIKDEGRKLSHNIKAYWDHLHSSAIGDEKLSQTITALRPYIDSLSQIDSDGQELRYHRNRDYDPSLSKHAVVNLALIRESLRELEKLISVLKYRTVDFIDEHATGTCTNRCSRADLLTIARLLPRRDLWKSEVFDQKKIIVQDRYGLSNKQFCVALDVIQGNPEMRSVLGMQSDLKYLADDDIAWVVEQWRRLHPVGEQNEGGQALDYFDAARFETMREEAKISREVTTAIESRLSPEALAELEAMFYLERERIFVEYYERMIARILREHAAASDRQAEILHLVEKTNFLHCVQGAAARLGRLSLAERLKAI